MEDETTGGREYRSYTTASFARWARYYDSFVVLFGIRGVRRAAVEMSPALEGIRAQQEVLMPGSARRTLAQEPSMVVSVPRMPVPEEKKP